MGFPSLYGGIPKLPSSWINYVPSFSDSKKARKPGKLLWAKAVGLDSDKAGSSAAEFISPCKNGGHFISSDETNGVGFLRISAAPKARTGSLAKIGDAQDQIQVHSPDDDNDGTRWFWNNAE